MSDSSDGVKIRTEMASGMERSGVKREFEAPGVHFGFRYESPIIQDDENTPPSDDPFAWQQSSYPGCRAPHAWLDKNKSTLDLFGHGFTLMCFDSMQGVEAFSQVCQDKNVPLNIHYINNAKISQLYVRKFVLVRPDGHVAWRGDALPNGANALVDKIRGN
jgi:hypothetical protein